MVLTVDSDLVKAKKAYIKKLTIRAVGTPCACWYILPHLLNLISLAAVPNELFAKNLTRKN